MPHLIVVVDPDDTLMEIDENNNLADEPTHIECDEGDSNIYCVLTITHASREKLHIVVLHNTQLSLLLFVRVLYL